MLTILNLLFVASVIAPEEKSNSLKTNLQLTALIVTTAS